MRTADIVDTGEGKHGEADARDAGTVAGMRETVVDAGMDADVGGGVFHMGGPKSVLVYRPRLPLQLE